MKSVVSILLFIILSGCSGANINNDTHKPEVSENSDAIVFLVFKMKQDNQGKNRIELTSQTQATGKMKGDYERAAVVLDNYLTVDLYQNNRLYKTILKEHPLYKHVEYPDDNGRYVAKDIEVKEDEFFFRIQKNGAPVQVRISETLKNSPKKILIDLKI